MKSSFAVLAALLLSGCGSNESAPAPAAPAAEPKVEKPADESARFPKKDLISTTLVEDHVLGKGLLPGGNVATYRSREKTYQLFLVRLKNGEAAAIKLLDFKSTLGTFKYLPAFGGYYGMDGATPVFVFQKGPFLAGITGLTEKEADPIAREFAARL
jgi:hypothetical protein